MSEQAMSHGHGSREMDPVDATIWRAEADRRLRSTIVAVEVLDCEPEWDRVVEAHRWATRAMPRLRERVVEPGIGLQVPRWTIDEEFDLHYHLRRTRLAGDGGWSDLMEVAEQLAMAPFDRERPLWEAVLVTGVNSTRAAYLLKMHHAITDGVGAAEMLSSLHSRTRAHNPNKPLPSLMHENPDDGLPSGGGSRTVSRITAGSKSVWEALVHPDRSLRAGLRYGESARRVLMPPSGEASSLLSARSSSWRFAALDVDFGALRSAGQSCGATVNDTYLAALMGAFRLYHEELGVQVSEGMTMPTSIPVSVRKQGDGHGGNHIAPARIAAPLGITDPTERIDAIHDKIVAARAEPALESAAIIAPVLCRLPSAFVAELAGTLTKSNDLQASNVPGFQEEVYLAGARIERIYPFAPLPGCAAMITMTTHGEFCCVGANLDAASIEDVALFGQCLKKGFVEVLQLASDAPEPVLLTGPTIR